MAGDEMVHLDLRGLKCPLPVLHARRALERAAPGTRIRVDCTDPMAVIDIPHLAQQSGIRLEAQSEHAGVLTFVLLKGEAVDTPQ